MPLPLEADTENRKRIVALLEQRHIDGLVCALPMHVLMLTGFCPVMGNAVAVVTSSGELHLLVPEDEDDLAAQSSTAARTVFHPGSLQAITTPTEAIKRPLEQLISRLTLGRSHIGIESSAVEHAVSYLSQCAYQSVLAELLKESFPKAVIVNADDILHVLCGVKTLRQLHAIRLSCGIAGAAYQDASPRWQPGMTELEVAAIFYSAYSKAATLPDVIRSEARFFCMSGENSATANAAYARTRQRTIAEGDVLMIHCNSSVNGYWTDITRTYVCGRADPRQQEIQAAIAKARAQCMACIAPGVAAAEVDKAARDVLTQQGFGANFTHGTGHGVGFCAASAHAIPRIHPKSVDQLRTGMTFNVEPAIYIEGYAGFRHCDMVAVNANGVELLTKF